MSEVEQLKAEMEILHKKLDKALEMLEMIVELIEDGLTINSSDDDDDDIEDFDTDETWVPNEEDENIGDFWGDYDPEEEQ